MHNPGDATKVRFCILPSLNDRGYFIAKGTRMKWSGAPVEFGKTIQLIVERKESIIDVSVGVDGDYFIKTSGHTYCHSQSKTDGSISAVRKFLNETPGCDGLKDIQWFRFTPNPEGWVCCYKTRDGHIRIATKHVQESLKNFVMKKDRTLIKELSIGKDGSWIGVEDNGRKSWGGLDETLLAKLKDAGVGTVQYVALDLKVANSWFIQYTNGGHSYFLRNVWLDKIKEFLASLNAK